MSAAGHTVEGMDRWQALPLWDDPAQDELPSAPASTGAAALAPGAPLAPAPPLAPAAPDRRWCDTVGVFDLETTGIDVTADRVVTAHVGVLGPGGEPLSARSWLADPGVEIPEGATAVHGITTAHARAQGRPAGEVVAEVVIALRELFAAGIPVVAYNAPYDFSLLKHEALRHGIEPIIDPAPVIDPLVLDKAHDRYRKGKRTLEVVAAHYAVTLTGAHDAAADAIAAGRVAQALAERFGLDAPAHELHTQQIGWARAQAESLTEYFIRIGRLDPSDALDGSWPIR
ncbi:exonuclease domain-containing protein [Microbacterium sp.]|uniref:exonuclease domain-containing protein n=1 Tax=Microbacterium sp. TaxID=51671 RepID=UPI0037CA49B6